MNKKIKEFINYIHSNFKTSIWGIQEITEIEFNLEGQDKNNIEFYIYWKTEDYKNFCDWSVPLTKFLDESIENLFKEIADQIYKFESEY